MARQSGIQFRLTIKPTFRDISGRYVKASDGLLESKRTEMRREGRRFVELAREEAPKKTGRFADGIRFRTFIKGESVGFAVTTPQPLGRFITLGTKKHFIPKDIRPPGKPLAFNWAKGPKGPGMYFFYRVLHPGTKPNKFMGRAYRRWLPGARSMLKRISTRFVRTFVGQ